jgi:hypothetical protein
MMKQNDSASSEHLGNALKFTDEQGTIQTKLSEKKIN